MKRARARRIPVEYLLAAGCLVSAIVLGYSDFRTSFDVVTPGGEPQLSLAAGDRHHYAMLVLAIFAVGALLVAVGSGSKPAAIAVGIAGGVALILFLAIDLPKANQVGAINDIGGFLPTAKAVPQDGFWLSLLGAIGLAASGAALATLDPEQLQLFGRDRRGPADASEAATSERATAPSRSRPVAATRERPSRARPARRGDQS
jgi:predicted membrane metal-binding protein